MQAKPAARQAFDEAVSLMKGQDFARAGDVLENALDSCPNDPNLLRLLGVSLAKRGRYQDAEQHFTHAVRRLPDFALAYENLADVQLQQGKVAQALESLQMSLKHNPASRQVQHRLGELLLLLGRTSEADETFRRSFDENPERRKIVHAMELVRSGDTAQAEQIYRKLLRDNPENVDALRQMGVLCAKKENFSDAEAFFQRAVELAPDFWMAWINLGNALNEQQQFSQAEQAYSRALELVPNSVHALERLGTNCMNDGRHEEAIAWLERALVIDETHIPALLCLGHALKTIGRQDDAIMAYRRCAAAKPDFGEVYWSLANLKTFRFSEAEVSEMEQQLAKVSSSAAGEDSEISFCFALGKAYEDREQFQKSFDHYSRGNGLKRLKVSYDPVKFQSTNDRIIDVFTREYFERHRGQGCSDDTPILIVGLPRSGSTLLEQILASHSKVEGTAELHYLRRIALETGLNRVDGIQYPECILELKPHHLEGLGQEYIENTLTQRTGARYFTDKMPNNFTGVGFLHTILPNAKVIDARRHPLDSCLGTFKQLFARGQVFSYDLYDLAHYYNEYLRMMRHWHDVLPGKVLTVHYEDVVGDLETQARRIALHCGLQWESSMLRFHETRRAVKTASSEQVRQPIYKESLYLWRRYENELAELIDYLEPALLELPEVQRPRSLRRAC